jgi:tetratricopeptide (TPR) repeat protein
MGVDRFGVSVTAAEAGVIADYDSALTKTLTFQGDPLGDLDRVVASEPRFLMAHLLRAILLGLSTDKRLLPDAEAAANRAIQLTTAAGLRESRHVRALQTWLAGRFSAAADEWEDILIEQPNDALALFAAHQSDFLLGRSSELRDRIARRLADVEQGSALEGYYLGMYAFGLEETGAYDAALDAGLRAVARDPFDAWAIHAVAHVYEMTNAIDTGAEWLAAHAAGSVGSSLRVHLAWHDALYHYDERRWDRILDVYDREMGRAATLGVMELVDASSLLWRLTLQDVEVGDRWQRLVEAWEPHIDDAWYAFNDVHAMMTFAGAGRFDLCECLIAALRRTAESSSENGRITREIGLPVADALFAYAARRYAQAAAGLAPLRDRAIEAGGSHAQRDVLGLTLASAAEKAGNRSQARALLNERLALRPRSTLNRQWMARVTRVQTSG